MGKDYGELARSIGNLAFLGLIISNPKVIKSVKVGESAKMIYLVGYTLPDKRKCLLHDKPMLQLWVWA